MLDPKAVRSNTAAIAAALKKKGFQLDVGQLENLEQQRKVLQVEVENLQAERNRRSKSIGQAKAAGADIEVLLAEVNQLKSQLEHVDAKLDDIQTRLDDILWSIPNF